MIFEIHKEIFDHFSGLRVVTVLVDDMPDTAEAVAADFVDGLRTLFGVEATAVILDSENRSV